MRSVEVLVLGGGPAGLASAIAAVGEGFQVEVLERFHSPIDKPCGEGIMPAGLDALEGLGVAVQNLAGKDLRGIRYIDGDTRAEGWFGPRPGRGVRRLELHRELTTRAAAVGANVRWGVVVEGLSPGVQGWVAETSEGPVDARWVIGADGLNSHVRRWAALEGPPARWRRFGVRRHYRLEPWCDLVEVYWSRSCEAYITPVAEDTVGVALLWSGSREGFDAHLRHFPELVERLAGAEVVSRDRGCGPFRQRVRRVASHGLALVGDAAGYVDALTGEGLGLAFQEAPALALSLRRRSLGSYIRAHRRICRVPDAITQLTLVLARHPALRRRIIRTLATDPRLFSRLLEVQNRDASLVADGVPALLRIGAKSLLV
ncbi:MAG: NAD(P)/FAD-dependent oxidoreductase [Acidobacteriota bacterium]|nr:NAD(P)/FAD-dependent oxidoreductase [Acidobacteriota bacterium]